ncbi:chitin deacetylase [Ceratobasidium sp. AG-Ba]|nr:chitin deacetylase [Ceratobasidium sp. AG-Ba]
MPRQATSAPSSVSLASTNPSAIPISSIYASMPTQATTALDTIYCRSNPAGQWGTCPPDCGDQSYGLSSFRPGSADQQSRSPAVDQGGAKLWELPFQDFRRHRQVAVATLPTRRPLRMRAQVVRAGGLAEDALVTQISQLAPINSYDDGPSPYTPNLLQYLDQQQLKSTFFIVGSRAISRPQILQSEYMGGHQLSVHTWSHPSLTTLTTEQIIAELGWTKKAIKDITASRQHHATSLW